MVVDRGSPSSPTAVEPAFILSQMRALLPPDVEDVTSANDAARVEAACLIWDLSTNAEASSFMVAQGVVPLLLRIVRDRIRHSDRLLETCLGTLANLVADVSVCDAIAARDAWSYLCDVLLSSFNSSVVLELLRVLSAALSTLSLSPLNASRAAYMHRWICLLCARDPLAQLLQVLANTLRRDVLLVGLGLLSAISYVVGILPSLANESSAAAVAVAMPEAFADTLLASQALPVIANLLVERWRDGEVCHAVLLPLEEMLSALASEVDGEIPTNGLEAGSGATGESASAKEPSAGLIQRGMEGAGLPAGHGVWRALQAIVEHADDMPIEAASIACSLIAVVALVHADTMLLMHLSPVAVLRLLRMLEVQLEPELSIGGENVSPRCAVLCEGVRAAWSLLHARCLALDGLELSLCGIPCPPVGGAGASPTLIAHPPVEDCKPAGASSAIAFEMLLRRAPALGRSARWAHAHTEVGVAKMSHAVLQLVHAAADAVATTSPGRAGGAILAGFNVISRNLSSLEHGGESDGTDRSEAGDEVEEGRSGWSDESDLGWAEGDGDEDGGLTPEDENLCLAREVLCSSDGADDVVEDEAGENAVGACVDADAIAETAGVDAKREGNIKMPSG